MEWILVMTLLNYDGSSVTTAKFDTQRACVDAGNAWAHLVYAQKSSNQAVAACYPTRK